MIQAATEPGASTPTNVLNVMSELSTNLQSLKNFPIVNPQVPFRLLPPQRNCPVWSIVKSVKKEMSRTFASLWKTWEMIFSIRFRMTPALKTIKTFLEFFIKIQLVLLLLCLHSSLKKEIFHYNCFLRNEC